MKTPEEKTRTIEGLRGLKNGLLQLSETNQNSLTTAAKNVRTELARTFPGIKFQVKTQRYSMGNNINMSWTDGPTSAAVKAISSKYCGGDFDGSVDLYTYSDSAWNEVYGEAKYVFENRRISQPVVEQAAALFAAEIGIAFISPKQEVPEDWRRQMGWTMEQAGHHLAAKFDLTNGLPTFSPEEGIIIAAQRAGV
jgi:hypothetical protein